MNDLNKELYHMIYKLCALLKSSAFLLLKKETGKENDNENTQNRL